MTAPEGWTRDKGGIWRWTATVSPEEYDYLKAGRRDDVDLDQLACACGASVTQICRTANGNPAGPHRYRRIPRRCTCGAALPPRKHVCRTCRTQAETSRNRNRPSRARKEVAA